MLKKSCLLIASLLSFSLLFIGCGGKVAQSTQNASYSTYTLSGTIVMSTASGADFSILSTPNSLDNYMIWAQNRGSKRVYFTEIAGDGSYTLPVEATNDLANGANFIICLVQEDPLEFIGTVMVVTGSATTGETGFEVGSSSQLDIAFNPSKNRGVVDESTMPSGVVSDESSLARLDGEGKPVGADNAGKGTGAQNSSLNDNNQVDKDQDGLPDIFDAANDGQNLDNSVDGIYSEASAFSDTLASIIMFNNLKVDNTNSNNYTVTQFATIVIEATPYDASIIDYMHAYMLHPSYTAGEYDQCPGGYTAIDTWPSENSLWSADEDGDGITYELYKVQDDQSGATRWTVLFRPRNNTFSAGDMVVIKVHKTDGTDEFYWLSTNFKFTKIPELQSISPTPISGTGGQFDPYIISDNTDLTLTWDHPKDESGATLTGLSYQVEIIYRDAGENTMEHSFTDIPGLDPTTYTISAADIDQFSSATDTIQVDIAARYPYGDNAANKIYFKRASW